jgi:hypothetical protein
MSTSSPSSTTPLTATYASQTERKVFSYPLPPVPAEGDTAQKTSYLSALREEVTKAQEEMNAFLTAKMEAEKEGGRLEGEKKYEEGEEEEEEG